MSSPKWRALVVEDESSVRQELIDALNESPEFEVVGWAGALNEGVELVKNQTADVLFLDIKIIGGSAFQLMSRLRAVEAPIPPVVINTGYREFEFAQRIHNHFKEEVIWILQKPFWKDWEVYREKIDEAIYARHQAKRLAGKNSFSERPFSLQDGSRMHLVNLEDVILVRSGPKGEGKTELVFQNLVIPFNMSLAKMLNSLPHSFVQINRREAINIRWISYIDQTEKELFLRTGQVCPIGEPFYKDLMKSLKH
jgi:DNA-binding LytR/AlgR family response regulator